MEICVPDDHGEGYPAGVVEDDGLGKGGGVGEEEEAGDEQRRTRPQTQRAPFVVHLGALAVPLDRHVCGLAARQSHEADARGVKGREGDDAELVVARERPSDRALQLRERGEVRLRCKCHLCLLLSRLATYQGGEVGVLGGRDVIDGIVVGTNFRNFRVEEAQRTLGQKRRRRQGRVVAAHERWHR